MDGESTKEFHQAETVQPIRPLHEILQHIQESRSGREPTTLDAELQKTDLIDGAQAADEGAEFDYQGFDYLPLNLNGATPYVRYEKGTIVPAAAGEKGAIAIKGIRSKGKGTDLICEGIDKPIPADILKKAQHLQIIDAGKREPNAFTSAENAELNHHLVENGFIPTESLAQAMTKNKKSLPAALPEGADEAAQAEYNRQYAEASQYNAEADALAQEIQSHSIMTEEDFGKLIKFQGRDVVAQMKTRLAELQQQSHASINTLSNLAAAGSSDFGLGERIQSMQEEIGKLETSIKNYEDPQKIAELYRLTRNPEVAKQLNNVLESGKISDTMDVMIQAQLEQIADDNERKAAEEKLKKQKEKYEAMAAAVGGGALILVYLLFMEGMKQQ